MNSQNPVDAAMAFVTKIDAHDVGGLLALMTPAHVFADALDNTSRGADKCGRDGRAASRYSRTMPAK
jgi:hypothetical protein